MNNRIDTAIITGLVTLAGVSAIGWLVLRKLEDKSTPVYSIEMPVSSEQSEQLLKEAVQKVFSRSAKDMSAKGVLAPVGSLKPTTIHSTKRALQQSNHRNTELLRLMGHDV